MQLGLMLTAHCNASCRHCSTSCGPQRKERLPREKIFSLMEQAVASAGGGHLGILLSGGEPFLDFELLLDIVARARALDAEVTCVTNGSWAVSAEKARSMLTAVRAAGLSALAVSTSPFHQQFIKLRRVERVLTASREVGLSCTVKYIRTRSDPQGEAAVRAWALAAGAVEVQDIPLMPHLREGATLPETEYLRSPGLPEGSCPAPLISIREDGAAFTCPQPGALTDLLNLGSVHEQSFVEIRNNFYLGGTQQLLRKHGPMHFARAIQTQGLGGRLRDSYTDVCDLCTHIASTPELAAVAAECSLAFEAEQLQGMLRTLVDSRPVVQ